MNWLVTGGCGFIGRSLIADLVQEPDQAVRVLDNLSTGTREALRSVRDFVELEGGSDFADWSAPVSLLIADILDEAAVAQSLTGAHVVVHLAANTGVPQSVADPLQDFRSNALGVFRMLEGCRKAGVKRFVFASSGAPLGAQTPPLHEEMAPHPASPYGASKLAGEGYCSAYYHCFGLETVILRFGNVYGEGSGHKQSVVAKFIREALAGRKLEIYGDGSQTRDFIHISDLVDALRRASQVPGIGGEVFQIATARETTVQELTQMLLGILREEGLDPPEVCHGYARAGDVERSCSDTTKARERLGWTAKMPLEEGLRRTVRNFVRSRPDDHLQGAATDAHTDTRR